MGTVQPLSLLYRRLWRQVPVRRRLQLAALFLLMLAAAGAEIFSIGAVLPFLGVIAAPDQVLAQPMVQAIAQKVGLSSREDLLLFFTLTFAAAALLSAGLRLLAMWTQVRIANAIGADFSIKAYERTLYQPYAIHLSRNSSEIHAGIGKANSLASVMIQPSLQVFSSFLILVGLLGTIFTINPVMALCAVFGFGGIYAGIVLVTRRRLGELSGVVAE
jgi:ATP-binding cassette subfamily B protein